MIIKHTHRERDREEAILCRGASACRIPLSDPTQQDQDLYPNTGTVGISALTGKTRCFSAQLTVVPGFHVHVLAAGNRHTHTHFYTLHIRCCYSVYDLSWLPSYLNPYLLVYITSNTSYIDLVPVLLLYRLVVVFCLTIFICYISYLLTLHCWERACK